MFGVAPAWRDYPQIESVSCDESDQQESSILSDMRIIDLQWLHAYGKGDDSVYAYSVNNDYRELMGKETFDYVRAQKIATAQEDRNVSIHEFGLHEDIQRDLMAYRTPAIEQEIQKIISLRVEVEKDLRIAAGRNYRMGKKLIDVMPDRLDQWMSIKATQSKSKTVMYETYKKITGSKIALSSYNTKLQSLKHALRLADSEYMV